jgi:uncharacterized protein (DUF1015 family)
MASIYPFNAIQYRATNLSSVVAPPYDVLDARGKGALLEKDADNIVRIDLPHTPAKELGPAQAYEAAGEGFSHLIESGKLVRRETPALFAYRQTTKNPDGSSMQRCGMAVCVDVVPFGPRAGGGVLPHEETFSGPKQDRMALMKATRTQLSPIFGLHADARGEATAIVRNIMSSRPRDQWADMGDGVLHEIWAVTDAATVTSYQRALAGEDIFIADGHHRYNTGLTYLKELEAAREASGLPPLPADHPARRNMMVLIGMSDPGLVIWPTHRVLGGMKSYSIDNFLAAASAEMRFEPIAGGLEKLDRAVNDVSGMGAMRFGIYDFATARAYLCCPAHSDPLEERFPGKPKAWRELVVAYIQYVLVEKIAQPKLNNGDPIKWAFPHTVREVAEIGSGNETGSGGGAGFAQLAVIVRPTPLEAVRDVSRAGELMPQKSTFFYPKLATGLFMHGLE